MQVEPKTTETATWAIGVSDVNLTWMLTWQAPRLHPSQPVFMRKRNHHAGQAKCTQKGLARVSKSRLMSQQQVWEKKEGLTWCPNQ